MRCVITGADGFVGQPLLQYLLTLGHDAAGWSRREGWFDLDAGNPGQSAPPPAWIERLRGTEAVIHLAGLAHQPTGASDSSRYFRINRDGTLRLATAAIEAGVRRFIFVSTAKVYGEGDDGPYRHDSKPNPQDAYALSKWEAEQGLLALAAQSSLEVVILRPPLVYATNAKANFGQLLRLARIPLPLPLARVSNRRSMIGLDNLIDLIAHCLESAAAIGTWSCADARPYSIGDVITAARSGLGLPAMLFGLPPALLRSLASATLGSSAASRLFGDFVVDTAAIGQALGWRAPYGMNQILRQHSN